MLLSKWLESRQQTRRAERKTEAAEGKAPRDSGLLRRFLFPPGIDPGNFPVVATVDFLGKSHSLP